MGNAQMRRIAEAAVALMHVLIPDPVAAQRLRAALVAALARPAADPASFRAIVAVLSGDPVLRAWVHEQQQHTRYRSPVRYLTATAPQAVAVEIEFAVHVQIAATRPAQGFSSALTGLAAGAAMLTITVESPGLRAVGHTRRPLAVSPDGSSAPLEFGFRSTRVGVHVVTVRAFDGGTFLGEVGVVVAVEAKIEALPEATVRAGLPGAEQRPGEITLQVSRTPDNRHSFQLLGAGPDTEELTPPLGGDPREVTAEIVEELRRMARGVSEQKTAQTRGTRLENLGISLWSQAVPEPIQDQFWQVQAQITGPRRCHVGLCDGRRQRPGQDRHRAGYPFKEP